jgi:hypothetical protein
VVNPLYGAYSPAHPNNGQGASVERRTAFNRAAASAFLTLLAVALAAPSTFADTPHEGAAATKGSAAAATALSQVLSKAVERGDAPAVVGLIVDRFRRMRFSTSPP